MCIERLEHFEFAFEFALKDLNLQSNLSKFIHSLSEEDEKLQDKYFIKFQFKMMVN